MRLRGLSLVRKAAHTSRLSIQVYSGHFRIFCEGYVERLRGYAFRQQLCHDHQPLIAGVFFIIFPAAGGKGQNGILLGEGYALEIQPVFPRNRFKEAGEIISRGIGRNIIEFNIRDEQRSDLKNHILAVNRVIDIRMHR